MADIREMVTIDSKSLINTLKERKISMEYISVNILQKSKGYVSNAIRRGIMYKEGYIKICKFLSVPYETFISKDGMVQTSNVINFNGPKFKQAVNDWIVSERNAKNVRYSFKSLAVAVGKSNSYFGTTFKNNKIDKLALIKACKIINRDPSDFTNVNDINDNSEISEANSNIITDVNSNSVDLSEVANEQPKKLNKSDKVTDRFKPIEIEADTSRGTMTFIALEKNNHEYKQKLIKSYIEQIEHTLDLLKQLV